MSTYGRTGRTYKKGPKPLPKGPRSPRKPSKPSVPATPATKSTTKKRKKKKPSPSMGAERMGKSGLKSGLKKKKKIVGTQTTRSIKKKKTPKWSNPGSNRRKRTWV
tara:strand:+ start:1049 stop:1366 length:318 start_codon:yes stop_codon:yes gene_type:complete